MTLFGWEGFDQEGVARNPHEDENYQVKDYDRLPLPDANSLDDIA